jgi:hypothetical protein
MPSSSSQPALRRSIAFDAVVSGTCGILFVVAPRMGGELLGLSPTLLVGVGVFFLAWAGALWWISRRRTIAARVARIVVFLNITWVVDSLIVLATGWIDPTELGVFFIVAQAVAVAAIALWQWSGVRREMSPA